ncbi:MAG: UDP-N-acetylmuramoylalanyl-D-glutamyl-2,6-diaminopimelate--D-alanyl-D-alanyl ligase [Parcubacteria group bacterium]|nr:UDP-N-acetylmuramoylalanyl-D-glutamyl-2,6-diaminopimelate--D-alanyl-D-alanyl ligase [Parcubacteria group bacterium]
MILAQLARGIVRKYRPQIVMVTGSVGKTSTKDAVAAALSETYSVRKSEKSYNSEFGLPFTILGAKNPWENPGAWLKLFGEALALRFLPNLYPNMLVLEVGADRPGDIEKMLRIALPDAVVVTRLPEVPVHVEAYATPAAVREEEFYPAYALDDGMPLILNAEDEYATAMSARLSARVISFGISPTASAHIQNPKLHVENGMVVGMQATLHIERSVAGEECELRVPGVVGNPALYAPAAAVATAVALGMSIEDACKGLAAYQPPPGRARVLKGLNGSTLIDDSYNSSPAASEEALASLNLVANELKLRRVAVLGDMLELGRYSHEEHERIGTLAAKQADVLITVGIRARGIADAAKLAGMTEESIHICGNSEEAALVLKEIVTQGDVVLIKGSQSVRTERIVESLLASPEDRTLLVRQDAEWKRR